MKLGGMSANATQEQMQALQDFGMATGLAFQIIDDILDVTQTSEKLAKALAKMWPPKKAPTLRSWAWMPHGKKHAASRKPPTRHSVCLGKRAAACASLPITC